MLRQAMADVKAPLPSLLARVGGAGLLGLLLAVPPAANAQLFYTTNNGTLTVARYQGGGAVIIPGVLWDMPVIGIGTNAFINNTLLLSVVCPYTITNIDSAAFSSCTGMYYITLYDSVQNIGSNAFYNCGRMTNMFVPRSVTNR